MRSIASLQKCLSFFRSDLGIGPVDLASFNFLRRCFYDQWETYNDQKEEHFSSSVFVPFDLDSWISFQSFS